MSKKLKYNLPDLENIKIDDNPNFDEQLEKHAERSKQKLERKQGLENVAFGGENDDEIDDDSEEIGESESDVEFAFLENLSDQEIKNLTLNQLVREGKHEVISELLKNQRYHKFKFHRQLLICDNQGFAPIHYAAKYNQVQCADVILNYCNSKTTDLQKIYKFPSENDRLLPIHLAARYTGAEYNEEIFDAENPSTFKTVLDLLLFYAKPNLDNQIYEMKRWTFEDENGNPTNILAVSDGYGMCAMHHAVSRGNEERVQRLIDFVTEYKPRRRSSFNYQTTKVFKNGVAPLNEGQQIFLDTIVNNLDTSNRTPLHYAALRGETKISEILLKYGADRLKKDADKQIPLHDAAEENNLETAKILLQKEVENQLFNTNRDGSTPVHIAVENNSEETAHFLMKTCYNSLSGPKLQSLVERSKIYSDSSKPLHLAVGTKNIRLVTLLVRYYHANTEVFNNLHETPLFIACKKGFTNIMKYLIIEGRAEKESRDRDGYTNLLIACSSGHGECVEALLKLGADIEAVNKEDRNAFHIVAQENRPNVQKK